MNMYYCRWGDTNIHYCRWAYLRCDSELNIISMVFLLENLDGKLPDQFNALSTLQVFIYGLGSDDSKSLAGTIPPSFTALTSLNMFVTLPHLEIDFNLLLQDFSLFMENPISLGFAPSNLSGTIPQLNPGILSLGIMNTKLSGTLPTSIELRPKVKLLVVLCMVPQLFKNSITGKNTDPPFTEVGMCQENPISGTLPEAIILNSDIQLMVFWPSKLSGSLPKFGNSRLENFQIRGNGESASCPLSGTLPELDIVFPRTSKWLGLASWVGVTYSFTIDSTRMSGTVSATLYNTTLSQLVFPGKMSAHLHTVALSQWSCRK